MKTCSTCLDSVAITAQTCPSCGAKFYTPVAQPVARPITQAQQVTEPKPRQVKKVKINPLVKLYSLVALVIAVLGIGSTIALTNNSGTSGKPEETTSTQPTQTESTQPSDTPSPDSENGHVKASSIMSKLTGAGVCEEVEYYSFPMANYGKDDLFRVCVVPSFIEANGYLYNSVDKYISIYTGDVLSSRYADISNIKVFEVAIIGDGWTVVSDYYSATNKTYMDDPDIKAMVKLLGGRTIAKE